MELCYPRNVQGYQKLEEVLRKWTERLLLRPRVRSGRGGPFTRRSGRPTLPKSIFLNSSEFKRAAEWHLGWRVLLF